MKKFVKYIKESNAEMRNVRWPGKKEAVIFTIAVVVVSFAVAYYLGLFDQIFTNILETVL